MDFRKEISSIYGNLDETVFDSELSNFSRKQIIKNKYKLPSLFRYSDADYYNIRGLETQSLYLSENGTMNDVFEGLTCSIDDNVIKHLDDIKDLVYLKSFSETNNCNLMWAHYANNYKGICVEYDFSKLDDDALFHLFPVIYSSEKLKDVDLKYTIEEHMDLKLMNFEGNYPNETNFLKDIMPLFLIKSKDWEYEKEWRLLFTYAQINNSADDIRDDEIEDFYKIHLREISVSDCIKAVYLGARIEKVKKKHIIEICQKLNIKVYASLPSKDKYELDFKEIDFTNKDWKKVWLD